VPETSEHFQATANRLLTLALTQHDPQPVLQETLQACVEATGGVRAFLARIEPETGDLVVIETAGTGWTPEARRIRLQLHNSTQRGITGYVAITGEPYITGDVQSDPHYLMHFEDARSEIAVPFFDPEGRVRGIVNVESDRAGAFCAEHISRLTTLASAIALALASDEYRSRERMLVEIGLDLAGTTEITPLLDRVVDVAARVLRCDACSLFLLDESDKTLTLQATRGSLRARIGQAYYQVGEGLTGTVAQSGQSIRLDSPRDDPRWLGRHPEFSPDQVGAFLAVAIRGRDRILGVLRVSRPRSTPAWYHGRFTEGDERVLRTIGSQLGTAIENVRAFNRLVSTERMAAWGELSAKSAHMIGNRTFAIKGDLNELKYLLAQCTSPQALTGRDMCNELMALTDSMERGVFRLEEILREFRDFVMATQLTLQETNINQIVQETVTEIFPRRSPIKLEQEYMPDLPQLRCDAGKLKRAFSELIENAVSFQPGGGAVYVKTRFIDLGQAPTGLRLSPARRYVEIMFADEGPGVPDDLKAKIFTPFYSSRVKGMGLGLSIVKGIIEAHHGVIHETGVEGQGARFLIYLPI
jgi:signal transduction histidine kinase